MSVLGVRQTDSELAGGSQLTTYEPLGSACIETVCDRRNDIWASVDSNVGINER